jgi:hypothetical protein
MTHIDVRLGNLDNERAHRLYRSRRFARTGRTMPNDESKPIGEWRCDCEQTYHA